jgi:hypothetical protein
MGGSSSSRFEVSIEIDTSLAAATEARRMGRREGMMKDS